LDWRYFIFSFIPFKPHYFLWEKNLSCIQV